MKVKPIRTCFIVWCNPKPLVYAIYMNYFKAIEYAQKLVDMRAKNDTGFHGYDGFCSMPQYYPRMTKKEKSELYFRDKLVYSACLRNKNKDEDGCFIQVEERIVSG